MGSQARRGDRRTLYRHRHGYPRCAHQRAHASNGQAHEAFLHRPFTQHSRRRPWRRCADDDARAQRRAESQVSGSRRGGRAGAGPNGQSGSGLCQFLYQHGGPQFRARVAGLSRGAVWRNSFARRRKAHAAEYQEAGQHHAGRPRGSGAVAAVPERPLRAGARAAGGEEPRRRLRARARVDEQREAFRLVGRAEKDSRNVRAHTVWRTGVDGAAHGGGWRAVRTCEPRVVGQPRAKFRDAPRVGAGVGPRACRAHRRSQATRHA